MESERSERAPPKNFAFLPPNFKSFWTLKEVLKKTFYSATTARQNQSSNGSSVFPKFPVAKFKFVVCLPSSLPLRACIEKIEERDGKLLQIIPRNGWSLVFSRAITPVKKRALRKLILNMRDIDAFSRLPWDLCEIDLLFYVLFLFRSILFRSTWYLSITY